MKADNSKLTRQLAETLLQKKFRICTAESCTGGLIAKTFTDLAGSSAWFDRGFVTYSNLSKIEMLAVQPDTLNRFGAVSEQVASEMATGALQHSQADISISVTGIAGPGGGSVQKPVGTVCFGFAFQSGTSETAVSLFTEMFDGNRREIRQASLQFVLRQALKIVASDFSV